MADQPGSRLRLPHVTCSRWSKTLADNVLDAPCLGAGLPVRSTSIGSEQRAGGEEPPRTPLVEDAWSPAQCRCLAAPEPYGAGHAVGDDMEWPPTLRITASSTRPSRQDRSMVKPPRAPTPEIRPCAAQELGSAGSSSIRPGRE